jgi:RNA polymerase sigma factor (sigma-70 family)
MKRRRFSEFVAAEWKQLVSYVRARLEDSEDWEAEDVVQEVLTGIYENADLAAPIADLAGYVYGALRNRIVDAYRRKKRTISLEADGLPPMGGRLLEVLSDTRFEAASETEKKDARDELFAAIDALPEDQKNVLVATELEGLKFRELSEQWDIPLGTLLARKHRAVVKLRAVLNAAGYRRGHHRERRPPRQKTPPAAPGRRALLSHQLEQGGII